MTNDSNETNYAMEDTLGGRISLARENAQLSLEEAARRLGVQKESWNDWECDRATPRANRLTMMAGILGVSPSWLLVGTGTGPSESQPDDVARLLRELRAVSAEAEKSHQRAQVLLDQIERHGQDTADGDTQAQA